MSPPGRAAVWWRHHGDAVLNAVALPLAVFYSLPHERWSERADWQLGLTVLAWLPLLARTRRPLPVLCVVAAVDTVHIALAGSGAGFAVVPIATILACYTATARGPAGLAWPVAAAAAVAQYLAAATTLTWRTDNFLYWNWIALAAAAGQLVQERRRRITAAAQRTADAARREVTAERLRIARELHDVLAHHIAVVNAQAGVADYLLDSDPAAARTALTGIAQNSRAALDELRATLGLLRDEDGTHGDDTRAPSPGADQIDTLLRGFAETGMRLTVRTRGEPRPLSGPADLAFYRITQEALTNASKHAPTGAVRVEIEWTASAVTVTVTNTACAPTTTRPVGALAGAGSGHGLLGMRERAAAALGSVAAGPVEGGGFQVRATLPLPSQEDRPAHRDPAPGDRADATRPRELP